MYRLSGIDGGHILPDLWIGTNIHNNCPSSFYVAVLGDLPTMVDMVLAIALIAFFLRWSGRVSLTDESWSTVEQ